MVRAPMVGHLDRGCPPYLWCPVQSDQPTVARAETHWAPVNYKKNKAWRAPSVEMAILGIVEG
ncbi:hypothetical protein POX_a01598 [Penicillium oxalicum]|uniref:hypothetical protein n=1 Tax=Penicillium oxalicum TaxID=69781 RepID=UPI0020B7FFB0|nr:hypothetical protein POX_a01598 [Penicillium oxalicum]KAI2794995.1 hypothetical protein POX_a01598 [Penicillium oxalicum]